MTGCASMSVAAELGSLHELHAAGALSDAEFSAAKALVLGSPPQPPNPRRPANLPRRTPPRGDVRAEVAGYPAAPGATAQRRAMMDAEPEARARIELAAAYRMAAHCGLNEADQNHFTLLHPTKPGKMLLIPQGTMWSEVRAGDLAEVDIGEEGGEAASVQSTGVTLGDSDSTSQPVEISAFVIHAPMHRSRPDAAAVLHTHMPYATALSSQLDPTLLMVNLNCLRFFDRVAYQREYLGGGDHEFFPNESGEELAAALGQRDVLLLANHGTIVVGKTLAEATEDLYYFERAAMNQILAQGSGGPLNVVDPDSECTTMQPGSGLADPGRGCWQRVPASKTWRRSPSARRTTRRSSSRRG